MNRTLVMTALAAGLVAPLAAQTTAPAAPAAAVAPQAIPAKVAIIAFDQAVFATNEGQKAVLDLQKKYEPKKNAIEAGSKEVDSLKAQLQALPANTSDEERTSRLKVIDQKQKDLQRQVEDAQAAYQADLQESVGKIQQKFGNTAVQYAQKNGFTLLLNYPDPRSQNPNQIIWFAPEEDITEAVINEYNKISGVAAPPPAAPAPARTTPAKPAGK